MANVRVAQRFSDLEYNEWLESIPQHIKELVFVAKRYYKPEWGKDWRSHFSVDIINGTPGNELKCDNRKLVTTYLRVGYDTKGAWRTFGLRKDFPIWNTTSGWKASRNTSKNWCSWQNAITSPNGARIGVVISASTSSMGRRATN